MGRPKKRHRTEDEPDDSLVEATGFGHPAQGDVIGACQVQADALPLASAGNGELHAFDPDAINSAFTPDGALQPWLLPIGDDAWLNGDLGNAQAVDATVPELTPDDSSGSRLIPKATSEHHAHHHHHQHQIISPGPGLASHLDPSTQHTHDPAITAAAAALGNEQAALPQCACLSSMYLALSNLSAMDPSFAFPYALYALREAMSTASSVIACKFCPQQFITGLQNVQLLGALLTSIAERFGKVVTAINTEASRAERANESKKFRLADLNTPTSHLHTNGLGCVAAFSLELSPSEWKALAKKVVKAEIYGSDDGCPHFIGLAEQMEQRQARWHSHCADAELSGDVQRVRHAVNGVAHAQGGGEHLCLKMIAVARQIVDGFDWT